MCGIVGYIGREEAAPILLDGLFRLEYRGYDSAGIVVCHDGELKLSKTKGHVQELSNIIEGGKLLKGNIGLGHTRWATHGQPSDVNAHPHMSCSGKIVVVHNGIIENYVKLREMLVAKGYEFQSDTDTEVAVNLIQYFYNGDILSAVAEAARRLEGSYALGILCSDFPDKLFAVRKEGPLIVGKGEGCNFIASDVTAVLKHTRDVYYMDDDEIAVLSKDSIAFYNSELEPIEKEISKVEWDISAAEKGGYEHFMFKEIMEQPEAIRNTISPRLKDGRVVLDDIQLTPDYVNKLKKVYFVAAALLITWQLWPSTIWKKWREFR